jgi:hypothetical protein
MSDGRGGSRRFIVFSLLIGSRIVTERDVVNNVSLWKKNRIVRPRLDDDCKSHLTQAFAHHFIYS